MASRRAALRRPPRRPGAPGDGVRRHAGAHGQPPGGRRGDGRARLAARRAVRQLARRHRDRDPPAARHQEGRRGRALGTAGGTGRARPAARPGEGPAASGGRPRLRGPRPGRPPRADQAQPAGEVPPGRGAPPHPRRRPHRRHGRRTPAHAHRGGSAPRRRPRLWQRLPHPGRQPIPDRGQRPAGAARRRRPARTAALERPPGRRGSRLSTTEFVEGTILDAAPGPPEVVLALHACDTATDEALARAVAWGAPLVLAAPCCHHDLAAQLAQTPAAVALHPADPARHPAREIRGHPDRCGARGAAADAGLPRRRRAVRREQAHPAQHPAPRDADVAPDPGPARDEYAALVADWGVRPRLADLSRARWTDA